MLIQTYVIVQSVIQNCSNVVTKLNKHSYKIEQMKNQN